MTDMSSGTSDFPAAALSGIDAALDINEMGYFVQPVPTSQGGISGSVETERELEQPAA
jgi:hypothetical protein